jgi:hypothetical protein
MKLHRLLLAAALAAGCGLVDAARADSWVFGNSYYSHTPPAPVQIGPRAVGGPYYTRQRGDFIRSGVRWSNSATIIGGAVNDRLLIRQSWVQFGAQY